MKYSLVTMKPNVMRRSFFSEILGINLRVWVSMKARRCIMKKGSFDNYILNTREK
jgi:ribosomal protein L28